MNRPRGLEFIPSRVKIYVGLAAFVSFVGLVWLLYFQADFLHSDVAGSTSLLAPEKLPLNENSFFTESDTLRYADFTIIRRMSTTATDAGRFTVVIKRRDSVAYTHDQSAPQRQSCQFGLVSLLGDSTRQLVVEQFSGEGDCCWTSVVIDLSGSVRILHDSRKFPELGYELDIADLDGDGTMELGQVMTAFDMFERLSHTDSPFPVIPFQYSFTTKKYAPANRTFGKQVLTSNDVSVQDVRQMADTLDFQHFDDSEGVYLSQVLRILTDYIYAGEKEKGWAFFDETYRLRDKTEIRKKIQSVLDKSLIYKVTYKVAGLP